MTNIGLLPPLPPSDRDSLDQNRYDGFYKVKARDFWGENEIHHLDGSPTKSCKHEFTSQKGGVRCTKCNFGLLGVGLSAKDGVALVQGEPISFP